MSEDELQLRLSKLLPDKLKFARGFIRWTEGDERRVKATEWLHVCALVEETIEDRDRLGKYHAALMKVCWGSHKWKPDIDAEEFTLPLGCMALDWIVRATWQQRAAALISLQGAQP